MPHFVCLGAPYFLGQALDERNEVTVVRASGFAQEIGAAWIDVIPGERSAPDPITAVNRALAQTLAAQRDQFPIVFASDCTSGIGAVKGLMSGAGLGVIWFDAHGDFNTPETSPSGFIGGMPLAMLAGRGDQQYMRGADLAPLPESDLILTDARDLDPGEAVALRGSAVRHLPHVRDLLTAPLPDKPLYIHLDTDVVDPGDMPAMTYAAPGGPSLEETAAVLKRVAREGRVIGMLLRLWTGSRATDDRPLRATLRLVRAVIEGLELAQG